MILTLAAQHNWIPHLDSNLYLPSAFPKMFSLLTSRRLCQGVLREERDRIIFYIADCAIYINLKLVKWYFACSNGRVM